MANKNNLQKLVFIFLVYIFVQKTGVDIVTLLLACDLYNKVIKF